MNTSTPPDDQDAEQPEVFEVSRMTLDEALHRVVANIEKHRGLMHARVDEQFDGFVALAHRDHAALKDALARGNEPEPAADIAQFRRANPGSLQRRSSPEVRRRATAQGMTARSNCLTRLRGRLKLMQRALLLSVMQCARPPSSQRRRR